MGWCVLNLPPLKTLLNIILIKIILDTTCLLICILKVSPSEDSTEGERERLLSETNSKTRSHSGEDAGIGSEQGELQFHGK